MLTRPLRSACGSVILSMFLVVGAYAAEPTPITLSEALDMVFEQNTSHALFLWEQELSEKREVLDKHPQITAKIDPAGIANGTLEKPSGSLTMTMPLGRNFDLRGMVTLGFEGNQMAVKPSGSLNLDYEFFGLPENIGVTLSPEESRQIQANSLVLETVDLLIQLRQQIDLRDYEENRLSYLEATLEAARHTPNYDDFTLRQALRDQVSVLAAADERLNQLHLRLVAMLGATEVDGYDPLFDLEDLSIVLLEDELREEAFASSLDLRRAKADVGRAKDELTLERRTRGWDVTASGALRVNEVNQGWNWDVGIAATKALYPRSIILEELELAVAKAEYALEMQENALNSDVRGAIQAVTATQDQLELKAEHLAEARDDLEYRQRQHEAGLVTDLQVQDAKLAVQKARLEYFQGKMLHAQSVLTLWNLCGRDLRVRIFDVMR